MNLVIGLCYSEQVASNTGSNIPTPSSLTPGWWSYYNVEIDILSDRIAKTDRYFKSVVIPDESPEKITLMNQYLANLDTYKNLRMQTFALVPKKIELQSAYGLNEWIQKVRDLSESSLKLKNLQNNVDYDEKKVKALQSDLHDLFVRYLEFKNGLSEKYELGLRVMVNQTELAINKERFKGLRVQYDFQKQLVAEERSALDVISGRIDFSKENLELLDANIQDAKSKLNKIKSVGSLQLIAVNKKNAVSLSPFSKSLLEQKSVHQKSMEALAEIDLINLLLIKEVTLLGIGNHNQDIKDALERKSKWEKEVDEIKSNIPNWSKTSQKELTRSIEAMTDQKSSSENHQLLLNEAKLSLITIQKIQEKLSVNKALNDLTSKQIKEFYGGFWHWVSYHWRQTTIAIENGLKMFEKTLFTFGDTPINFYGIIRFFFTILIFCLIGRFFQFLIKIIGKKQKKIQSSALYTLSRLGFYFTLVIGVITAFSLIGVSLTAFAFFAGIFGVGLGFGLQNVFHNFIAGILILLEKNLRVGDFIQFENGDQANVKTINVRNTLLTTRDGVEILVPNAEFISKSFKNLTLKTRTRRVHIPFFVAHGTDKERLRDVLLSAIRKVPMTLTDEKKLPQLWLVKFGEFSLEFEAIIWVDEYTDFKIDMATTSYYLWLIHNELIANGFEIPVPRREIKMLQN